MKRFHVHMVSDATGETLHSLARAALAQFENIEAVERPWSFVRSMGQVEKILAELSGSDCVVLFTLVKTELRDALIAGCEKQNIPCVGVLDPVMNLFSGFLGEEGRELPGRQHMLDEEYFDRIEALHYTMAHDDGMSAGDLDKAHVILVGVSRTTKTPTCIYLANRGIKAANVPIVPGLPLPEELEAASSENVFMVGLTITPERLVPIRHSRLTALAQDESNYVEPEAVRDEVNAARRLFTERGWPVIDVTRKSIEETAAAIINLMARRTEA